MGVEDGEVVQAINLVRDVGKAVRVHESIRFIWGVEESVNISIPNKVAP